MTTNQPPFGDPEYPTYGTGEHASGAEQAAGSGADRPGDPQPHVEQPQPYRSAAANPAANPAANLAANPAGNPGGTAADGRTGDTGAAGSGSSDAGTGTSTSAYGSTGYGFPGQGTQGYGSQDHGAGYGSQGYGSQGHGTQPYGSGGYGAGVSGSPQRWSDPYGAQSYGGQYAQQYGQGQYGPPQYGQQGWSSPYGPDHGGHSQQYGYPSQQYGYGYPQPYAAPQQRPARGGRGRMLVAAGAGMVAAAVIIGSVVAFDGNSSTTTSGTGSVLQLPGTGQGNGSSGGGSIGASPKRGKSAATATQASGVVTIVSVLKYQNAESAGTGTIMNSSGEILTNNHVIDGATSITVTVQSTGRSYRAKVVGTAPTKDVAVLQLRNASGLTTARYASSSPKVGDAVVGVGNAGGTGTLTASTGQVTALNKTITASDESGQNSERLHGLIETDAPIISGDSGGPLYAADGSVIGMDTAASTNQTTNTTSAAYAIPIGNALKVAKQIESGVQTTTIHIGLPGFLGIAPTQGSGGVLIPAGGVVVDSPAQKAGITGGSTITAIDGTAVSSPTQLHNLLSGKNPGTKVKVSWTDAGGASHTATVSLATGPAD